MFKREIYFRFWGVVIFLCNMGLYLMGFSIIIIIEKNVMIVVIYFLSIVIVVFFFFGMYLGVGENWLF